MKEHTILPGYDGRQAAEEFLREGRPNHIWENPESPLFVEWYLLQMAKSPEDQAPEYNTFLLAVDEGKAKPPTEEQIARYKIDEIRHKKSEA